MCPMLPRGADGRGRYLDRAGPPSTQSVRVERRARRRDRVAARQRPRLGPATPTSTRPPTAPSWATSGSCGARGAHRVRGRCARRGPDRDVLEVGSRRRPVLALGAQPGRPGRRSRPVAPAAAALAAASTRTRASRCPRCSGPRPRCPSPTARSTWCSRPSGRSSSSARSASPSTRLRGCCARAAASRSPSPTRPAGCSPTTPVAAGLGRDASPTGTGRRTSRSTTRPALVSYVEHHRTLGDWVALLAERGLQAAAAARARVARRPRPGVGRLVAPARPAHPRHRDLRGGPGLRVRLRRSSRGCATSGTRRRAGRAGPRRRRPTGTRCGRP